MLKRRELLKRLATGSALGATAKVANLRAGSLFGIESPSAGKAVCLRVRLRDTHLYAFWFASS